MWTIYDKATNLNANIIFYHPRPVWPIIPLVFITLVTCDISDLKLHTCVPRWNLNKFTTPQSIVLYIAPSAFFFETPGMCTLRLLSVYVDLVYVDVLHRLFISCSVYQFTELLFTLYLLTNSTVQCTLV